MLKFFQHLYSSIIIDPEKVQDDDYGLWSDWNYLTRVFCMLEFL